MAQSIVTGFPDTQWVAPTPGKLLWEYTLGAGESLTLEGLSLTHFVSPGTDPLTYVFHIFVNVAGVPGSPLWTYARPSDAPDAKETKMWFPKMTLHGPAHIGVVVINLSPADQLLYWSALWTRGG